MTTESLTLQRGDVFVCKGSMGLVSAAIRGAQRILSRDNRADYGHAGIITSAAGATLEALWTVRHGHLDAYAGQRVMIARPTASLYRPQVPISLRTRALRQFTIGHVRHRLVTKVEIIDNGPGIPAELQETIFFPMVSGRPDGTGLGLAITQNIISQHQGLIECESHPGHTTFSIFLPLEQGAPST